MELPISDGLPPRPSAIESNSDSYCRGSERLAQAGDSIEVALICNSFGVVCKYTATFEEGERFYHRALPVIQRVLGPERVEVAALYHNHGRLGQARGRFAAGQPLARRSVQIRQNLLGPDNVEIAADLATLAVVLDGQGKHDESLSLCHQALEIFERAYGTGKPGVDKANGSQHLKVQICRTYLALLLKIMASRLAERET